MGNTFRTCLSLFKIKAAEGLQYRLAALSGATVSVFWALIEVVVMSVFFKYGTGAGDVVNGMSLRQAVSYIWIAQFLVGLSVTGIDGELMAKIVSGDIGVELCRPLDFYWHWFAKTAAGKASAVGLRGSLTVLAGAALTLAGFADIGMGAPPSFAHAVLFLASLFNAFFFSAAYCMFMTSIRLGVPWGDGPLNLIGVVGMVLSGAYFPLQLWPDAMQAFLRVQPFAGFTDAPARLYAGSVDINGGLVSIAYQIAWIIIFIIAGRIITERKLRNVIIQGG